MSRSVVQSKDWEFTVEQRPLPNPLCPGKNIPFFGNFRQDTGECLGVTSESYGLIQNTELMAQARRALEERGLTGFSESVVVTGDGKRFYAKFEFRERQLASGVGDVFGYILTLRNSFDRSLRAAFSLGFLRLVCSNGAATLEKEFAVTQKHSSALTADFVGGAIDRAMSRGAEALRVYDELAACAISDEQGVNVLDNFVKGKVLSAIMASSIKTLWLVPRRAEDKPRTMFSLYNAATEHLTHQVARDRFEYAERTNVELLLTMVNAARKPAQLASLIVPVPEAQIGAPVVVSE